MLLPNLSSFLVFICFNYWDFCDPIVGFIVGALRVGDRGTKCAPFARPPPSMVRKSKHSVCGGGATVIPLKPFPVSAPSKLCTQLCLDPDRVCCMNHEDHAEATDTNEQTNCPFAPRVLWPCSYLFLELYAFFSSHLIWSYSFFYDHTSVSCQLTFDYLYFLIPNW